MNYLKSLAFGQYESEVKQCECDGSSSGGALVVKITKTKDGNSDKFEMDHTWQEIYDAGNCVVVYDHFKESLNAEYRTIYHINDFIKSSDQRCAIEASETLWDEAANKYVDVHLIFNAASPDDYPYYTTGGTT